MEAQFIEYFVWKDGNASDVAHRSSEVIAPRRLSSDHRRLRHEIPKRHPRAGRSFQFGSAFLGSMLALLCACTAETLGLDADVIDGGSPDDAGFVDAQASCEPVDAGFDGTEALCPGNNLRETSGLRVAARSTAAPELYYCPGSPTLSTVRLRL